MDVGEVAFEKYDKDKDRREVFRGSTDKLSIWNLTLVSEESDEGVLEYQTLVILSVLFSGTPRSYSSLQRMYSTQDDSSFVTFFIQYIPMRILPQKS